MHMHQKVVNCAESGGAFLARRFGIWKRPSRSLFPMRNGQLQGVGHRKIAREHAASCLFRSPHYLMHMHQIMVNALHEIGALDCIAHDAVLRGGGALVVPTALLMKTGVRINPAPG